MITANTTDTFVYTIKDGDGDLSTTTLTINLSDVTLAGDNQTRTVDEAALDTTITGSDVAAGLVTGSTGTGSASETATGTLAVVDAAVNGYTAQTVTTANGKFVLNTDGTYTYTLTSPVNSGAVAGANTVNAVETFTYTVRDVNNNTTTGTVTINVIDDVPSAVADSNTVAEGGTVTGNLLTDGTDDVFGADGSSVTVPVGGITGVRAGSNTALAVTDGTTVVTTALGTLTLSANGSYTYVAKANVITANTTDTFVYTVKDGDGDLSTTKLEINVTNVTVTATDNDVLVNEAGLPTGSLNDNSDIFTTGKIVVAGGGTGPYTYAITGNGGSNLGTISLNAATGDYTYTLNTAFTSADGTSPSTEDNKQSFSYTVTDANGNISATGTIFVDVIDDVPTAVADTDSIAAGSNGPATGNVITDLDAGDLLDTDTGADAKGADGASVSAIKFSLATVNIFDVNGNLVINGDFGVLSIKADGSYSYARTPGAGGGKSDTFTYTLKDSDGDIATATLTISIGDIRPVAGVSSASVDDEGLSGGITGAVDASDLNANVGERVGFVNANEAIFNGRFGGTAGDGASAFSFASTLDGITATVGQDQVTYTVSANGLTLTATISGVGNPRANTVLFDIVITDAAVGNYTLTLKDNVLHALGSAENNFDLDIPYQMADADGDFSIAAGVLSVTFDDDTPAPYFTAPGIATGLNKASTTDIESLNLPGIGADGPGALSFNVGAGQQARATNNDELTFNGQKLYYNISTTDPTVLEARTGTTAGTGTLVYSLDLNASNGAAGEYVYTQYQQLSTAVLVPVASLSSVGGGNMAAKAIDVPNSAFDLVLTTKVGATINTNANVIGVGAGQSLADTDVVRIDFVNVTVTGNGGAAVATFNEYYSANAFRQDVNGLSGGQLADFTVQAIKIVNNANNLVLPADGDTVFYGDTNDLAISGTTINIYDAAGVKQTALQLTAAGVTVTDLGGGVWQVLNLPNLFDYEIVSQTSSFQAVQIDALVGTGTFKLGALTTSVLQVQGVSFSVPINYTDADGDLVSSTIAVNLAAPIDPVVLDLDGDGAEFLSTAAGVTFDYFGDGSPESTAWVGADDGLLAIDRNGDGIINDGSEIVFARDGLTDLQGLAADYDSNRDGFLTAADNSFGLFGIWQDANSNGITDAGEYRSLSDAGIVSIGLVSDGVTYTAANGDVSVAGEATYTKANGATGLVADAAFGTAAAPSGTSRLSDQLRTSNVTSSIVAASLVGMAATSVAANLAPESAPLKMLSGTDEPTPNGVSLNVLTETGAGNSHTVSTAAIDPARVTGDVASNSRAVDDSGSTNGLNHQPVSHSSDLLADSSYVISIASALSASAPIGGDMVLQNILDMAAANVKPASNDNLATTTLDALVRGAMPDNMVDRLIEAFDADLGAPSVGGGMADNAGYLLQVINQSVTNFHDHSGIGIEPAGPTFQDMMALHNA